MLWFLVLHIIAMLFWCAALLYLPALIAASHGKPSPLFPPGERGSIARFVFTNIASPAAVVAIMAGTVVFLLDHTVEFWLLVKLVLVTGLTIVHSLAGLFLLKIDSEPETSVLSWCWMLALAFVALITAIIWIVLAKPVATDFPWAHLTEAVREAAK